MTIAMLATVAYGAFFVFVLYIAVRPGIRKRVLEFTLDLIQRATPRPAGEYGERVSRSNTQRALQWGLTALTLLLGYLFVVAR